MRSLAQSLRAPRAVPSYPRNPSTPHARLHRDSAAAAEPRPLSLSQDCSDLKRGGPWDLTWNSLSLTPDPPVKGAAASWVAKSVAGSKVAISGGTGVMTASLDGVNLYTSPPLNACGNTTLTLPLGSGVLVFTGFPCGAAPVAANKPVSVSAALTLGTVIPAGNFAVVIKCVGACARARVLRREKIRDCCWRGRQRLTKSSLSPSLPPNRARAG